MSIILPVDFRKRLAKQQKESIYLFDGKMAVSQDTWDQLKKRNPSPEETHLRELVGPSIFDVPVYIIPKPRSRIKRIWDSIKLFLIQVSQL